MTSILLAFGIQAWWDWRRDRVLERDALQRLEADFIAMDAMLVDWRANHNAGFEAAKVLLGGAGPNPSAELREDSLASLLGTLRTAFTLEPPFTTLSALESSGQISVIRDQDLLGRFAAFRALIDDLQSDEIILRDFKISTYLPYLIENVPLRATPFRGPVISGEAERSAFPGGFRQVLASREFENIMVEIQRRTANTLVNYDVARSDLAIIIESVR